MVDENIMKAITERLRSEGVTHLIFADLDGTLFMSCSCSQGDLFLFLMSLVERIPEFKDIIIEVADDLEDSGIIELDASDMLAN